MLGLVRRRLAIQEQEFGAQQSAALGAVGDGRRRVGDISQIGEYLDTSTIQRAAFCLCFGLGNGAQPAPPVERCVRRFDGARGWRALQGAAVRIDNDGSAGGDFANPRTQADQHGDFHRGRENGHMRGRAAAGQTNGEQPLPVQRGQFRRQQVRGEQHGLLGQRDDHRPCLAGERQQHLRFHIEQVIGPFAQPRVAQGLERGNGAADGGAPGESGALAGGDERIRRLVHLGIVEKLPMGRDDGAPRGDARLGQQRETRVGLRPRLVQCGAFMCRAQAVLDDRNLAALDARGAAHRKAAHGDCAAKNSIGGHAARRGRRRAGAWCGVRGLCGARGWRRAVMLHAQGFVDAGQKAGHRLRSVGTDGPDRQFVAVARAESHDGDHAARIGAAPVGAERDQGLLRLGALREQGGRPGVQAMTQGHDERMHGRIADYGGMRLRRVGRCCHDLEQQIARGHGTARSRSPQTQAVERRHHYRRHQTLGGARHDVEIDADQLVAGANRCSRPHARLESPTAQADGIDADVNQEVDALRGADGYGVGGCRQRGDLTGAGREQNSAGRIDGEPVAEHALREYRVGNFVERAQPAIEGREDLKVRHVPLLPDLDPVECPQRIKARARETQT